jgi:DNA repair protein RadC
MSFHGLTLNEDEQRNRAYAALLAPPRNPNEQIDCSKEILAELKKMNELMKVQISLLKEIRDTTKTLSLQARPQAANPQPALNQVH